MSRGIQGRSMCTEKQVLSCGWTRTYSEKSNRREGWTRKVKLIINKEIDVLRNQDISVIETEIGWVLFFFLTKAFHYYASLESTDRHVCAGGTDVGPQKMKPVKQG